MITKVRCSADRTVFQVDSITLEPMSCGCYDAYCFSDPEKDVTYIEYEDWVAARMKGNHD